MCWYDLIPPSLSPSPAANSNVYDVAYDYTNSKAQHWVPILAILCDGWSFQFLVYDSGSKSVYSSGTVTGLVDRANKPQLFALSIKESKCVY
jgi:hypothetical protein